MLMLTVAIRGEYRMAHGWWYNTKLSLSSVFLLFFFWHVFVILAYFDQWVRIME